MDWTIRLEGGPADGDSGECERRALPACIHTAFCPRCHDWHWFERPQRGTEAYHQHEVDEEAHLAKYVYDDLIHGPFRVIGAEELVPA